MLFSRQMHSVLEEYSCWINVFLWYLFIRLSCTSSSFSLIVESVKVDKRVSEIKIELS